MIGLDLEGAGLSTKLSEPSKLMLLFLLQAIYKKDKFL